MTVVMPSGSSPMKIEATRRYGGEVLDSGSVDDAVAASLAPAVVGRHTYALSRRYVDDVVTVPEAHIAEATRLLLTAGRLYAEPGAAVPLATLFAGVVSPARRGASALIVSGGNLDLELLRQWL